MKPQILIIHGGTTFNTYEDYLTYLRTADVRLERTPRSDWKDTLAETLPTYEVLFPSMPSSGNAKYDEWSIWFERIIPLLRDNVTLIGHSLGGIFLAKYLSEHTLPVSVASIHLVAAPYNADTEVEGLGDFRIEKPVTLPTKDVYLYYSKDDIYVPFEEGKKYVHDLPDATFLFFEDRGHFFTQDQFPELAERLTRHA